MKKIHQLYFKEFLYTFKMTPFKKILIFFILLQKIQANEMQSYGYDIPNTPITVGGYLDAVMMIKLLKNLFLMISLYLFLLDIIVLIFYLK